MMTNTAGPTTSELMVAIRETQQYLEDCGDEDTSRRLTGVPHHIQGRSGGPAVHAEVSWADVIDAIEEAQMMLYGCGQPEEGWHLDDVVEYVRATTPQ